MQKAKSLRIYQLQHKSMIRIKEPELISSILTEIKQSSFLRCSGDEKMFLPEEQRLENITHSVKIGGI